MKRIVFWLATIPVTCGSGCGTAPTPAPTPGPDVTDYSLVCSHLADLGCPEGKDPSCAVTFGRVQGSRLSDLQPSCLMAAKTADGARACGSVLCGGDQ